MAEWIIGIVRSLGYPGIAMLMFLENLFPPIPSELIMPFVGMLSQRGQFALTLAITAGTAGSLAGACAWYWLGRRVSEDRLRRWIDDHGRWIAMDCADLDNAQQWFARYGWWAVFVCRLLPGLRTYVSLPAGLGRMPLWRFLLPTAAGTAVWTAALTWAGTLLGQNYAGIEGTVSVVAWIVLGAVVAAYVWRQVRWRRRVTATPPLS